MTPEWSSVAVARRRNWFLRCFLFWLRSTGIALRWVYLLIFSHRSDKYPYRWRRLVLFRIIDVKMLFELIFASNLRCCGRNCLSKPRMSLLLSPSYLPLKISNRSVRLRECPFPSWKWWGILWILISSPVPKTLQSTVQGCLLHIPVLFYIWCLVCLNWWVIVLVFQIFDSFLSVLLLLRPSILLLFWFQLRKHVLFGRCPILVIRSMRIGVFLMVVCLLD